jgi:hypothetical protein
MEVLYDKAGNTILSAETMEYIQRTHWYDGVIIIGSLILLLSTVGGMSLWFWAIVSLYTLFVGWVARDHARHTNEPDPYIVIFVFGILILMAFNSFSNTMNNLTNGK